MVLHVIITICYILWLQYYSMLVNNFSFIFYSFFLLFLNVLTNLLYMLVLRCLGMLPWMPRHPACVCPVCVALNHRCCGIHLAYFHYQKSSFKAFCGMLFSYMFQCLGIFPCMLRHTPCVFSSCCSIELSMPWINMHINQSLPQNSQRYWFSLVLTCFPFFNQQSYTI